MRASTRPSKYLPRLRPTEDQPDDDAIDASEPFEANPDDPAVADLREKLLESRNYPQIETEDLVSLHTLVRRSIDRLFSAGEYARARQYILVCEGIDDELERRGLVFDGYRTQPASRSPSPPRKSTVQKIRKFDEETIAQLTHVQMRHNTLMDSYMDIWEQRMKEHYFKPSRKLRELRQRAIDLNAEGRENEANQVKQEAAALQDEETEEAQKRYQSDFDRARAKIAEKHDLEMECLLHERLQKRKRIIGQEMPQRSRSQCGSTFVSPSTTRMNSPRSMSRRNSPTRRQPALLSFEKQAHKASPTRPSPPKKNRPKRLSPYES